MNNPKNESIHHIRGITYRAMYELLEKNHFRIEKIRGQDMKCKLLGKFPKIAPQVLFTCKKI